MKALNTIEAVLRYSWPYARTKVCELTLNYNCNARCIFCYSSPEISQWKDKSALSVKTASSYMLDSYKTGSRILQLIGGEPTVYPHLPEIVKIAKKIGYPVIQIVTNGQKMADFNYALALKEAGLNTITFSIHSHNPQKHDEIVGVKGAFKKMILAIENSIKLGIYPAAGTAINALNYKDIPKLVKFLHKKFKFESYHLIAMHFIGGAQKNSKLLRTKFSQTLPYIKETMNYLASNNVLPISPLLSNYQPCILPGFEHLITDWKLPVADDDLFLPEKVYKERMYSMITDTLRMKGKNCEECIYKGICAGFEKQYFKIYKDKEFKPLKSLPKPFALSTFYKN